MKEFLLSQSKRQHCESLEDFYAAIGYGGVLLSRIMPRIKEDYLRLVKAENLQPGITAAPKHYNNGGVIIDDMENCLVKFARCCNPVPGDEIIGFITRGYGVSVHKRDCVNVPRDISQAEEPARWVRVHWEDSVKEEFKATLHIDAVDPAGSAGGYHHPTGVHACDDPRHQCPGAQGRIGQHDRYRGGQRSGSFEDRYHPPVQGGRGAEHSAGKSIDSDTERDVRKRCFSGCCLPRSAWLKAG